MTTKLRKLGAILLFSLCASSYSQNLQISGGNNFSSVVCNQQVVNVTGYNADGQLGVDAAGNPLAAGLFRSQWQPVTRGNLTNAPTATAPSLLPPIRQADAGSGGHLLGLDCSGNVWAWGLNDAGQLGRNVVNGTHAERSVPMRVLRGAQLNNTTDFLQNVTYVSGGNNSSFAIEAGTGRVLSWGANDYGQLGNGTIVNSSVPTYVLTAPGVFLTNIVQIEAGDDCSYALDASGQMWSWGITHDGANPARNVGRDPAAQVAAAGGGGRLCLPYAGRVQRGTNDNNSATTNGFLDNIVSISGGDAHALALDRNGMVWSMGGDWATGQIGQGNGGQYNYKAGRVVDIGVTAATGPFLGGGVNNPYKAIAIAAGQSSCAIVLRDTTDPTNLSRNRVVAFGSNAFYSFNSMITQPTTYTFAGNRRFISGTIGRGQCGGTTDLPQGNQNDNNNTDGYEYPVFVETSAGVPLSGVTTISDGDAWYFATNDNGTTAVAWGWNRRGELATGVFTDRCYAQSLTLPTSCGFDYPCPGQPLLPANFSTCPVFSTTLDPQIEQTYTTYKYNWQFRATPGSGAWTDLGTGVTSGPNKTVVNTGTNSVTYNANVVGEYRVLLSDTRTTVTFLCGPCPVLKDSITITEKPNPYTVAGCYDTPAGLSRFDVTAPGSAVIDWYDAPTGGTKLNTATTSTITVNSTVAPLTPACGSGRRALFAQDNSTVLGTLFNTGATTPTLAQIAAGVGCAQASWNASEGPNRLLAVRPTQNMTLTSVSYVVMNNKNYSVAGGSIVIYSNTLNGTNNEPNQTPGGTLLTVPSGASVPANTNQVIQVPLTFNLTANTIYWIKADGPYNEQPYFNCNFPATNNIWNTPFPDANNLLFGVSSWNNGSFGAKGSVFDIKYETGTGYDCGRILVCESTTCTLLPVEMLYFYAEKNGTKANLYWATSKEENSSHFIVERSSDGINWAPIGRREAAGNSTTAVNYDFTDEYPLNGRTYYRLVQVDIDKTEHVSMVAAVDFNTSLEVAIHPNPSNTGLFNLSLSNANERSLVKVYTTLGQLVVEKEVTGNYSGILDLSSLSKGAYRLVVLSGATSKNELISIE
ncbi:MAG: T9SS type A sorting domain-containing protein [Cytophagaceae bacterium]|nr:T9SS type A sorting domain-containing protein [Cytophagaceae bacterium]